MSQFAALAADWRAAELSTALTSQPRALVLAAAALLAVLFWRFVQPRDPYHFPTWILLEGQLVSVAVQQGGWLQRIVTFPRRHGSALVHGATRTHAVLVHTGVSQSVLRKPAHTLHNDPAQWLLSQRVFGLPATAREDFLALAHGLLDAVARNTLQEARARPLMQRTYALLGDVVGALVPAAATTADDVAAGLVARPWLAGANMTPSPSSDASARPGVEVEVELFALVRDLTTRVSLQMFAGADFVARHPDLVADLFTLDDGFALLALGVPAWFPLPLVRRAVAARGRVIDALARFAGELDAVTDGTADAATQARLADVNALFYDRAALYRSRNLSLADRGAFDFALLWAMNANTSPLAFWMVAYLAAHPHAWAAVRAEVTPHVDAHADGALRPDAEALLHRCPRLKAAFLETLRLVSAPTSIRYLAQDVAVVDPRTNTPVRLPKGTHLSVAHAAAQHDPTVWPDPAAFQLERFLVPARQPGGADEGGSDGDGDASGTGLKDGASDGEAAAPGPLRAQYGPLKPWGDGPLQCKGRLFAERESLVLVGLLVAAWDVVPCEGTGALPSALPATGVARPATGMRVRISRRVQ